MKQNLRRHRRIVVLSSIRLTWQDGHGTQKYARGRCLDVSLSGARVEIVVPIPPRTYVTLSAEKPAFSTNASVRHCQSSGSKYLIGLEFSCPIKALADRLLEAERELAPASGPCLAPSKP